MKIQPLAILGIALLLVLAVLPSPVRAQELKYAHLGDFRLESGETIRDCQIGYRTFGKLNHDRSNAILIPTWANGTSDQLKSSVGPYALLDDSKYFIVAVDALANGVSSSPSNSPSQPHMRFPKITVRDMVNSQHRLVLKILAIQHLKAVVGVSMGGMQAFQWMVAYPYFMDIAIPIVGSPRLAPYDVLLWQLQIDAIKNDARWNEGEYTQNPAKKVEFEIGALLLTTPEHYNLKKTRADVLSDLAKAESDPTTDGNNKIRQAEAMIALDVSADYGHAMGRAAAAVKAKVLVIVSRYDHVVTPKPALDFAAMIHSRVIELESNCGHSFGECDNEKVAAAVKQFLEN